MPARGLWIKNSGKPQGRVRGRGAVWEVEIATKSYKNYKSGFPDRASAEEWRRRQSNKHGLTRNRIRKKVGHPGVREMMIHQKGPWTGDLATFSARDLQAALAHIGKWSFNGHGYVAAMIAGKLTKFCNLIRPPPPRKVNDHINRVHNDDRRPNLRFVTMKENARSQTKHANNTSGENGISECYRASFHAFDHVQGKWLPPRGPPSTSKPAERDLRKEAKELRDRLGAKTKLGKIPKISYTSKWSVEISQGAPDGGRKSFKFVPNDTVDRQRALQEAIVHRDMLQARCNSTNGKPATTT